MPRPLLISSQSDYLIRVLIEIQYLMTNSADPDLKVGFFRSQLIWIYTVKCLLRQRMSCLAREWLRVNEMQYSSRKDGILDEISQVSKIFQRSRSQRLPLYQVPVNVVVISPQKHNMCIATDKRGYPHIIFLISRQKHMLWVLIRSASPRRF